MSDVRFLMIGVALVFAGFLVLGIFGSQYREINLQETEFGNCEEYTDNNSPRNIECPTQYSTAFFALVLALLGSGVYALIRGYRGRWDNEVRPEDMLGPGDPRSGKD